ncbi:hypothetical protein [Sediminibacillus sp. JSM 1682029]|uniref:hypothetical protein n=1 Tax=Sediminibacillus sp. JSM 1682029 TaxID=3229857 RepID=UPI003524E972
MREETRSIIYMALDLLDSIQSSSSNITSDAFIKINNDVYDNVKKELFDLVLGSNTGKINNENFMDEREELIGVLPLFLIDKEKFPSNNDIIKLAENSLNIFGLSKRKRSRNELIGIIVTEVAKKKDSELDLFLKAWKKFTQSDSNNIEKNKIKFKNIDEKSENFVDTWLEFFHVHKGRF